jgi:hypothetical protein
VRGDLALPLLQCVGAGQGQLPGTAAPAAASATSATAATAATTATAATATRRYCNENGHDLTSTFVWLVRRTGSQARQPGQGHMGPLLCPQQSKGALACLPVFKPYLGTQPLTRAPLPTSSKTTACLLLSTTLLGCCR